MTCGCDPAAGAYCVAYRQLAWAAQWWAHQADLASIVRDEETEVERALLASTAERAMELHMTGEW